MDLNIEILIIMLSPFVVIMLFQLSSYLNQTLLSTGMKTFEIEDFVKLTRFPEKRVRMITLPKDKVKFKVLDENLKEEIGSVIFDQESSKVTENINIEIPQEKISEFRKLMFSRLTRIPVENLRITQDGDTFSEVEIDPEGREIVLGSVTFDMKNYGNPPLEISGKFRKLF